MLGQSWKKLPGSCLEFPYYVLALVRDERALYGKCEVSPHRRELHPVAEAVPSNCRFPSGLQSGWWGKAGEKKSRPCWFRPSHGDTMHSSVPALAAPPPARRKVTAPSTASLFRFLLNWPSLLARRELPIDFYKLWNLKPVSSDEREGEIRAFQHLQISSFHHFKKEFLSLTILKINDLLITIKESSKQRDPGIQFF